MSVANRVKQRFDPIPLSLQRLVEEIYCGYRYSQSVVHAADAGTVR